MQKFKIQRGIDFLKIVLSELSNPQVLKFEQHPAIPHMWQRMQDLKFDPRKEPFEYRSLHFPRFMKSLYIENQEIPKEFKDFADSTMIFYLLCDFVRANVLKGTLQDVLDDSEKRKKEYMFFGFKFFAAMEDKQIDDISLREGIDVGTSAVLAEKPDGSLEILTGADIENRKKNKKTDIISWNPFGENNLDYMQEVCAKKGEMAVISNIQNDGFEVIDFQKTDFGQTKITAEKKETAQKIEVYMDAFGTPKQFIDTAAPDKKEEFKGRNWRDELNVFAAKSGKHPDVIAARAERSEAMGAPKSEPRHQKIRTGTLKVDGPALENSFGPKPNEDTNEHMEGRATSKGMAPIDHAMPNKTNNKYNLPFEQIQKSTTPQMPKDFAMNSSTTEESKVKNPQVARGEHRPRMTESGKVTGRTPNQRREIQHVEQSAPSQKKKKKSTAAKVLIGSAIGTGMAGGGVVATMLLNFN